jgi:hypothetical protein
MLRDGRQAGSPRLPFPRNNECFEPADAATALRTPAHTRIRSGFVSPALSDGAAVD